MGRRPARMFPVDHVDWNEEVRATCARCSTDVDLGERYCYSCEAENADRKRTRPEDDDGGYLGQPRWCNCSDCVGRRGHMEDPPSTFWGRT